MEDLSKAKEFILKLLIGDGLCVDGVFVPQVWVVGDVAGFIPVGRMS